MVDGWPVFAPDLAEESGGYDPSHFARIPDADVEHYWRRARNRLFAWALERFFPRAASFLEIGSGNGVVLSALRKRFPRLQLWGSEVHTAGLRSIQEKVPGVQLLQCDARQLPFRNEFDVLGAFDVLEHIEEDHKVLQEAFEVAKEGGGILLSVPQHPFLWSQRDELVHHKRRYRRRELIRKVRNAGFSVRYCTSFITFPFPMMCISALRNRRPRPHYDPFAEHRVGPLVNGLLNAVLSTERQLLKRRIALPFGGSLFLVAEKAADAHFPSQS